MFNGFPATNTPAVQVWDFFNTQSSTLAPRSIYLTDDCAPIQYFKTGANTTSIRVYLPTSFPEGKILKFINASYGGSNQSVNVYSSDASDGGTTVQSSSGIYYVTPSKVLDLIYSKAAISFGTSAGSVATGWLSLTEGSVTSNTYRAVAFGSGNATANNAFAACGAATASGTFSVAIGGQNINASGAQAVALGGTSCTASGQNSAVIAGSGCGASGQYSAVLGGNNCNASGQSAVTIGGAYASTKAVIGEIVFGSSSPIAAANNVSQAALLILGRQTTDATTTILASDNATAGSANQLVLTNNNAFYVRGSCIANVTGGGNTKAWTFDAVIKRGANAAATSIVGAVVKNVVAADAGASTWDITVSADTTNGALAVSVTGQAATTIRWVCKLESTEVAF